MCSTSFSGSFFSASGTRLPYALFLAGVQFSLLPRVLLCFFVVSDLLFTFVVLSCRILDSESLFILYIHEHDRLGFGMLTVETAYLIAFVDLVLAATEKVSLIRSNSVWNRWKVYSKGRVHKSEPEPPNGNVDTVHSLIRPGETFESVAPSFFTMNEHAIANVYLYLNFLLRICS